jgi:hypothetical protein
MRRRGCPSTRQKPASAVPKVRVNARCEDVIFFDGVFFEPSSEIDLLRVSIFFLVVAVPQG